PEEMAALFADHPEATRNAWRIAQRCRAFSLASRSALGYSFPDFSRQPGEEASSADEVLAAYCQARFAERYPPDYPDPEIVKKAQEQLVTELRLVERHGLA